MSVTLDVLSCFLHYGRAGFREYQIVGRVGFREYQIVTYTAMISASGPVQTGGLRDRIVTYKVMISTSGPVQTTVWTRQTVWRPDRVWHISSAYYSHVHDYPMLPDHVFALNLIEFHI